jgi:hypothetical protein
VRGKVQVEDEQDTPTILADSVQTNIQVAFAAEDTPRSRALREPDVQSGWATTDPWESAPAPTPQKNRPAPATANRPPAKDNFVPPPPPNWEDDDSTPAAASNGNGGAPKKKVVDNRPPQDSGELVSDPTPGYVLVEVDASGDWQETFRQAVALSAQHRGEDRLALTLAGAGLTMDFPERCVTLTPALKEALVRLSGVRDVRAAANL